MSSAPEIQAASSLSTAAVVSKEVDPCEATMKRSRLAPLLMDWSLSEGSSEVRSG